MAVRKKILVNVEQRTADVQFFKHLPVNQVFFRNYQQNFRHMASVFQAIELYLFAVYHMELLFIMGKKRVIIVDPCDCSV